LNLAEAPAALPPEAILVSVMYSEKRTVHADVGLTLGGVRAVAFNAFNSAFSFARAFFAFCSSVSTFFLGFVFAAAFFTGFFLTAFLTGFFAGFFLVASLRDFGLALALVEVLGAGFVALVAVA